MIMTVKELYETIGGDYNEALRRLSMDQLIGKFIVRFLEDTSCSALLTAWAQQDEKGLFEEAHAAKGVCANLALTSLAGLADTITEATRPGNEALRSEIDLPHLVSEFEQCYADTVREIRVFAAQQ